MNIKKFYKQNQHKILPAFRLVKKCLIDYGELKEEKSYIDYVTFAMVCKDNYNVIYNVNDPYNYFSGHQWKRIENEAIAFIIRDLIRSLGDDFAQVACSDSSSAYMANIDDVQFGWVIYEEELDSVYVNKDCLDSYLPVLADMFWKKHTSGHVTIGQHQNNGVSTFYVREDSWDSKIYPSPRASVYVEELSKYIQEGIYRSVLFYGPPGTGKSNLVRDICQKLQLKTIRIKGVSDISGDILYEVINIFNPDGLIIEDIDSCKVQDLSDLLDKFEKFNKIQKFTFGTANHINNLESALIRPQRFDKLIEIKYLEESVVKELTNNDPELFELCQHMPAAYIMEIMKRVKIEGKEKTLDDIQDLKMRLGNTDESDYSFSVGES